MEEVFNNRMYFSPPCGVQRIDTDGNCQWKALSWACFGTTNNHAQIRHRVCAEIQNNWSHYKDFVLDQESYVQKMSKQGAWGDHCTLNAFCNVYEQHVLIMCKGQPPLMIQPTRNVHGIKANQWLVVVYDHGSMHYNSVNPYYASPTSLFIRKTKSNHS